MSSPTRFRLTPAIIIGSLAVGIVLFGLVAGIFAFITIRRKAPAAPAAQLTVLPAPTLTPTLATPTPAADLTSTPQAVDGMAPGVYVQITGTGGDGLRLRTLAGTDKTPRFLGYESEVFQIKDGPTFADGMTWWFLEAPYDPARAGWAAGQYLTIITAPEEPTP